MTKSMRALLVGAALTGFVSGTSMAQQQPSGGDQKPTPEAGKDAGKAKVAKHCCKGQNDCKGQGGCAGKKGKNDCKGQGGCSTKSKCAGKGPCAEKKDTDKK
jgi:hypothetical protein